MFEKEAEEYIKEHTFFDEEYGVQSLDVISKTIFKDGAEFGYNKANEWHYVKDGDLPECEEYVWCLFKNAAFPFTAKLYFGLADNDYHWKCLESDEEYYVVEVYAWKEIVIPMESE